MIKKLKKGFTLVELIVVIAIIAILSTVAVVGFTRVVDKANLSNDTQLVRNLNERMSLYEAETGYSTPETAHDAFVLTEDFGFIIEKLTPTSSGNDIVWDITTNRFALIDATDVEKVIYSDPTITLSTNPINLWKMYKTLPSETKYSMYLAGTTITGDISVSVGVDVGRNWNVEDINYINTSGTKQEVVIRTNSQFTNVTVEAPLDEVKHFGAGNELHVKQVAPNSLHTYGSWNKIIVDSGKVEISKGSFVGEVEAKGGITVVNGTVAKPITGDAAGSVTYGNDALVGITNDSVLKFGTADQLLNFSYAQALGLFDEILVNVELSNSIDLGGKVWFPIGTDTKPFTGLFDGRNFTISNLTNAGVTGAKLDLKTKIFSSGGFGTSYGLFGYTRNATIKNIKLTKALIESSDFAEAGFIVGSSLDNLTIENISIDSESVLVGLKKLGSIVGEIELKDNRTLTSFQTNVVTITGVSSAATITASSDRAGGLVGAIYGGNGIGHEVTINGSSFTGTLNASVHIAGAVAHIYNAYASEVLIKDITIKNNYNATAYLASLQANNFSSDLANETALNYINNNAYGANTVLTIDNYVANGIKLTEPAKAYTMLATGNDWAPLYVIVK